MPPTFSFVNEADKKDCWHWAKMLSAQQIRSLLPESVDGGNDVPGPYLREDVEVPVGDFVLRGESNHRYKFRGYSYRLGVVVSETEIVWLKPTAERKAHIKASGAAHLMGGSGGVAGMVRMARWIVEGGATDRIQQLSSV